MEMEFGESSAIGGQNESMKLPLGFRFDPHPRELVFYLKLKNFDLPLPIEIPEVDLYECHPKKLTTGAVGTCFGSCLISFSFLLSIVVKVSVI